MPALPAQSLVVIVSGEDSSLQAIARTIERDLAPGGKRVRHVSGPQLASLGTLETDADLVISIGNAAATVALATRDEQPLLCAFVSESTFRKELLKHFDSVAAGLGADVSAIYFEQPPERMFKLASLVVPGARVAGMALGPVLELQQARLLQLAQGQGLELLTLAIEADANPIKTLDPLVKRADVLMAMPDKAQWHSRTAKWLLYLAYRRSKPVIAFSARYTDAGAVASLYSRRRDVAEQTTAVARKMLASPVPGAIYWPEKFQVSTNPVVARALGLTLLDAKDYERLISTGDEP
jgi:ABC-type uncharacterized transport system substrate-binding protein